MYGASHCETVPPGGVLWRRPTRCLPQVHPERLRQLRTTPGGWIPPQRRLFVLRRTSGFRCGPSSRRGRRSPSSPAGCPGTGRQAALLDHARPAGWANAPARGMLALWLTISPQGWPPTGFTTPSMSWPGRCRPSWRRWLAPQRFLCYRAGLARMLLSSRACPASLPPRRVPGVSPSCSTLARRTASSTLARLRRSAFRRRLTRAPHLRVDGRPWRHTRPACAGAGAPRPG